MERRPDRIRVTPLNKFCPNWTVRFKRDERFHLVRNIQQNIFQNNRSVVCLSQPKGLCSGFHVFPHFTSHVFTWNAQHKTTRIERSENGKAVFREKRRCASRRVHSRQKAEGMRNHASLGDGNRPYSISQNSRDGRLAVSLKLARLALCLPGGACSDERHNRGRFCADGHFRPEHDASNRETGRANVTRKREPVAPSFSEDSLALTLTHTDTFIWLNVWQHSSSHNLHCQPATVTTSGGTTQRTDGSELQS